MNVQLENINVTQRDGRVTHLDRVYIRGSHVRLFIVPDMLRCVFAADFMPLRGRHSANSRAGTPRCSDRELCVAEV